MAMAAGLVVPSECVSELRQCIHSRVTSEETRERIRACVERASHGKALDEASLLKMLEEDGVVEQVLASLTLNGASSTPERPHPAVTTAQPSSHQERDGVLTPSITNVIFTYMCVCVCVCVCAAVSETRAKRCLMLQVLGGRAFIDHLHDDHTIPSSSSSSSPFFILHVYFCGQRFISSPVQCACEPEIRETFLLELNKQGQEGRPLDLSSALSISDSIHLVLTRSKMDGEREMVGTCHVEWRQVRALYT